MTRNISEILRMENGGEEKEKPLEGKAGAMVAKHLFGHKGAKK